MFILFASIPVMILAVLIAVVPLVVTMRKADRERRAAIAALEGPTDLVPGPDEVLPTAA